MKDPKLLLIPLFCALTFGFTTLKTKTGWRSLFNGKDLSGWDSYLGPDLDDKGKPITNIPIGLNNDPGHVFTVVNLNGENVIRVSGDGWGAITTKSEFENYHLQVQFKWGTLLWGQRKGQSKDSGLLYHSVGKFGADYGAWMRSHEFQIEQSNTGEYWGCAGALADVPADKKPDNNFEYSPAGTLYTFSQESPQGRHCMRRTPSADNPIGKWNTLDLYCHGDTSVHVVNGKVVMVLYHLKQSNSGQNLMPLTKGKIQLQSEGSEIFYKQIKIQDIKQLPKELFL